MSVVLKKYTGTLQEQLAAYKNDRCETDLFFKSDVEAARFPAPVKKVKHD